LLKAARKQGTPLTVVEWPGGDPEQHDRKVALEIWRRLVARIGNEDGLKNIPIGRQLPETKWLGLPHASIVDIHFGPERLAVLSGPATYAGDHWQLPVLDVFDRSTATDKQILARSVAKRREFGWEARAIAKSSRREI